MDHAVMWRLRRMQSGKVSIFNMLHVLIGSISTPVRGKIRAVCSRF
jgi:hypothetical protein